MTTGSHARLTYLDYGDPHRTGFAFLWLDDLKRWTTCVRAIERNPHGRS